MEEFTPVNELDRALIAAQRSLAAMPALCRELAQGELFLLIPQHPGMEENDRIQLTNGMEVPFLRQPEGDGEVILIFSSEERAEEGMRRGKVPPNTYCIVSMSAIQTMEVLGKVGLPALVNKSCAMPQLILPPQLMLDIASGEVFKPARVSSGETQEVTLCLLDPADYPTDLLQAAFEILCTHRQFRAAWIFALPPGATSPSRGRSYQFIVLMDPPDDHIYQEFNLVVSTACHTDDIVRDAVIDESDPVYVAKLFRRAHPFYVAADFAQPAES